MIQGRLLGERQCLSWILKDKCERTEENKEQIKEKKEQKEQIKTGYVEAPNCETAWTTQARKVWRSQIIVWW